MTPIERRTAQALLVAEGAALSALRATVRAMVGAGASKRTITSLAARVEADALPVIRNGKLAAKRIGSETMTAELASAVRRPVVLRADILLERDEEERAAQEAADLANGVRILGDRATSTRIPGETLTKGLDGRVRRIAATQVGESFNRERDDAAAEWARDPDNQFFPIILRRWNAMIDACPVCRGLHGQARPLGVDYADGQQPGKAHPHCRCFSTIIPIPLYVTR